MVALLLLHITIVLCPIELASCCSEESRVLLVNDLVALYKANPLSQAKEITHGLFIDDAPLLSAKIIEPEVGPYGLVQAVGEVLDVTAASLADLASRYARDAHLWYQGGEYRIAAGLLQRSGVVERLLFPDDPGMPRRRMLQQSQHHLRLYSLFHRLDGEGQARALVSDQFDAAWVHFHEYAHPVEELGFPGYISDEFAWDDPSVPSLVFLSPFGRYVAGPLPLPRPLDGGTPEVAAAVVNSEAHPLQEVVPVAALGIQAGSEPGEPAVLLVLLCNSFSHVSGAPPHQAGSVFFLGRCASPFVSFGSSRISCRRARSPGGTLPTLPASLRPPPGYQRARRGDRGHGWVGAGAPG